MPCVACGKCRAVLPRGDNGDAPTVCSCHNTAQDERGFCFCRHFLQLYRRGSGNGLRRDIPLARRHSARRGIHCPLCLMCRRERITQRTAACCCRKSPHLRHGCLRMADRRQCRRRCRILHEDRTHGNEKDKTSADSHLLPSIRRAKVFLPLVLHGAPPAKRGLPQQSPPKHIHTFCRAVPTPRSRAAAQPLRACSFGPMICLYASTPG